MRRKRAASDWMRDGSHQSIRPLGGALLRAIMEIRAHRAFLDCRDLNGPFFRSGFRCAGQPFVHPVTSFPRTSAGTRSPKRLAAQAGSGSPGGNLRVIAAFAVQHAPGDARELVGQRGRQHIPVQPRGRCHQPAAEACLVPVVWALQKSLRAAHEQGAQVAVATLGEAAQDRAVAGRDLLGHQPEPGGEVAAFG